MPPRGPVLPDQSPAWSPGPPLPADPTRLQMWLGPARSSLVQSSSAGTEQPPASWKDRAPAGLGRTLPSPCSPQPTRAYSTDTLVVGATSHITGRGLTAACHLSLQVTSHSRDPISLGHCSCSLDLFTWKVLQASVPGSLSSSLNSVELTSSHSCDWPKGTEAFRVK